MRLCFLKSKRATQVVNETPTPSTTGALEFGNVFSDTRYLDSDAAGTPFLRVHFPRISHRFVGFPFENDVRLYDASDG